MSPPTAARPFALPEFVSARFGVVPGASGPSARPRALRVRRRPCAYVAAAYFAEDCTISNFMGRPRKTCAALKLPTPCEACANPKKKMKCCTVASNGQRPDPEADDHSSTSDDAVDDCNTTRPRASDWKPAETGRPATTCSRLGLPVPCAACQNPRRKMKCLAVHDDADEKASSGATAPLLKSSYKAEDWRTEKNTLPEFAARKGVQNLRTAELDAQRKVREAELREQGFDEAIKLSLWEQEELEGMVSTLQLKLKWQAEELLKTQREGHSLMAAKRQRALGTWLLRPEEERAELRLPTRKSHFDIQADAAKGYSKSELQRTFRSHVERIEHFIESMVSDPLKQMQLADAVSRRFGGVKSSLPHDNEASTYVLESLRNFEATLRQRFSGRYPNEFRAVHQAVSAAITSKVPRNKLSVVAEATGFSLESLADGRRRWALWFDGNEEHLIEFRGRVRSDKMDEAWIEFAVSVWETETRPDPSTKCSIRNPHNRSDEKLYRIHYLDMRIGDMHQLILKKGREKFPDANPPFHFSWWYCIMVSSARHTCAVRTATRITTSHTSFAGATVLRETRWT